MKISKKIIGIGSIIGVGLIFISSLMVFNKDKNSQIDLPIAIKTENQSPRIAYGSLFDEGSNRLAKGERISVILKKGCEVELAGLYEGIEVVQLIYDGSDLSTISWEELGEQLSDKEVYISTTHNEALEKKEVQDDYSYIQEQLKIKGSIESQIIYDYRVLSTFKDVEYVGINITEEKDIEELLKLQNKIGDQTKIIVNDWIVDTNKGDLTKCLDLINELYYNVILYMPSVDVIYQNNSLSNVHERIPQEYSKILNNSWITTHEDLTHEQVYITEIQETYKVTDELELLIPYNEEIEYVEYKLNGEMAGQFYRYPYTFTYEAEDMYHGMNQLRVIVKYKDSEMVKAKNIYLDVTDEKEVAEKSPRSTPQYPVESQMTYDYPYIPVLMYHDFKAMVGSADDEQSITVGTKLFEEQLVAMLDAGYTPITFLDLENYFEGSGGLPEKPVIVTTDDGYLSNYTIAYPILQKYNVPATYFITSTYIGVETTKSHFTWEQALEMEQSGLIDIQSHTHAHALLDQIEKNEVLYQVGLSFEKIEENLGKRDVKILSYPQFQHNKNTVEWIQATDVNMQVTNLAKRKAETAPLDVKRIHVSNLTTSEMLLEEIEKLTMK